MQPLYKFKNQLYLAKWDCRAYPRKRYTKWILCFLTALIDRNVMTSVMAEVDLAWPRNLLLGVEEHLFPLRDPPGSARNREQYWKHRHREPHRLINEAGVKIDVGLQFALHEVIVFEGNTFALQCDFEERVLAHELEHFIRDVFDDAGSGIVILVHAMAESHEFHFPGLDALNEVGIFLDEANVHDHMKYYFIAAAV